VPHPLIEADARANLCLHDIADDPSSIYTLPMSYLVAIIGGLQAQGIADRVRDSMTATASPRCSRRSTTAGTTGRRCDRA
jgi:hypothetical protein